MKFFRQAANILINSALMIICGAAALIAGVGHYIQVGAMWLYNAMVVVIKEVDDLLGEDISEEETNT